MSYHWNIRSEFITWIWIQRWKNEMYLLWMRWIDRYYTNEKWILVSIIYEKYLVSIHIPRWSKSCSTRFYLCTSNGNVPVFANVAMVGNLRLRFSITPKNVMSLIENVPLNLYKSPNWLVWHQQKIQPDHQVHFAPRRFWLLSKGNYRSQL